jgi:hypothetical protein
MCGARECEAPSCETVTMQDYPFSANRKLGEQVGREPVYPPRASLWTPLWLLNLLVASGRPCSTRCSGECLAAVSRSELRGFGAGIVVVSCQRAPTRHRNLRF